MPNVVGFKINGNTYEYDHGHLANIPTIDATPTDGSTNAVESDGTFDAIAAVQAAIPVVDTTPAQNSTHAISSGAVWAIKEDLTQAQADIDTAEADIDALETAVSGKVAKPTTSPNGTDGQLLRTNGDGTTTWSDYASPTDAQVDSAVSDWLDDHPEATTTVEDGSLTVAKFTSSAQMQVLNDYVTPEMYGAVGDGETNDTQAIKDMFASGNMYYYFPSDIYLVDGGIDVTTAGCRVDFGAKTQFKVTRSYDVRDFNYVIGFCALSIKMYGHLEVTCAYYVNIGVWLSQCGGSRFERITVTHARIWGISTDSAYSNLGSMHFDYIQATACGYKINAVGLGTGTNTMTITLGTISNSLTEEAIRDLFDTSFGAARYVIDDSNFQDNISGDYVVGSRMAWLASSSSGIVLDESDITKATFTDQYGGQTLASFYDDEDSTVGRNIFIPVGGGVKLQPAGSEGLCDIDKILTTRCPIGIYYNFQYGGTIRNFASQYDTICMSAYAIALTIQYMYLEAVGTGFQITDKYNRIYLISPNSNTNVEVINPFVGSNRIAFYQENEIACQQEVSAGYQTIRVLNCSSYLANSKLNGISANSSTSFRTTIDEYSPRNIALNTPGFSASYNAITLDLQDLHAQRINRFEPFTMNVRKTGTYTEPFKITLSSDLIDAGYTINGATDNVLSIAVGASSVDFAVKIILFGHVFYVFAEELSFGNEINTYPTTSTVSSMISTALAEYENGNTSSY